MKNPILDSVNAIRKMTLSGAAIGLLLSAQVSLAAPPGSDCGAVRSECAYELGQLCTVIDEATSIKSKVRDGLKSKALGADAKLASAKLNDTKIEQASGKLDEIEHKIDDLVTEGKIGDDGCEAGKI